MIWRSTLVCNSAVSCRLPKWRRASWERAGWPGPSPSSAPPFFGRLARDRTDTTPSLGRSSRLTDRADGRTQYAEPAGGGRARQENGTQQVAYHSCALGRYVRLFVSLFFLSLCMFLSVFLRRSTVRQGAAPRGPLTSAEPERGAPRRRGGEPWGMPRMAAFLNSGL